MKEDEGGNYYLRNIKNQNIILPNVIEEEGHVWHLFVIRTKNREKLQNYLINKGIQTIIHYPIPPHKQKAYKEWNNETYIISEKLHNEIISIPISSVIEKKEYVRVVEVLNDFI